MYMHRISTSSNISIRKIATHDIQTIVEAFKSANLPKPAAIFETYLQEQASDARLVWVAYVNDEFAGYATLKWQSQYQPFAHDSIPEIMDLNVLPSFRKAGIASRLLDIAEKEAASRSEIVGMGVGLYVGTDGGYGAAQRLYVKRGYIPNGNGVTYNYQPVVPGRSYPFDDDLVLWLTKKLK
jgi:ribosomal protein S18 acetylase RimI-like enzyme